MDVFMRGTNKEDFFNNVLYDVKVHAVKEQKVWKEVAVRNRMVVKMI